VQLDKVYIAAQLRGLLGAAVGGVIGYFLFAFLVRQGFYALAMPGALLGLACGYASGIRSLPLAAISGAAAFLLQILLEWKFFPFVADESLTYFLTHLHHLRPATLMMMALGVLFAIWFGLGRQRSRSWLG
jgi:hypothetical protein